MSVGVLIRVGVPLFARQHELVMWPMPSPLAEHRTNLCLAPLTEKRVDRQTHTRRANAVSRPVGNWLAVRCTMANHAAEETQQFLQRLKIDLSRVDANSATATVIDIALSLNEPRRP
jgi:hypothetical protein